MMRLFIAVLLLSFSLLPAQKMIPLDSLKLKEVSDFLVDDYQNLYIGKNRNLSVTRYDSLGVQNGKLLFALPFRIQTVQNSLRIPAFSVNSQTLKFFDQNLNETETVTFPAVLGFITGVFSEDQRQVWILDSTFRRLVEYNFREQKVINTYLLPINYDEALDFIIFKNKLYFLTETKFSVYNLKGEKLFSTEVAAPKRLRRENGRVYIIGKENISEFIFPDRYHTVFQGAKNSFVDKNSVSYFELKDAKLYLYSINNGTNKQ